MLGLLLTLLFGACVKADVPGPPLACNKKYAERIRPYIERLIKEGPPHLISEIQNSKESDLWNFNQSYQQKIRQEVIFAPNGNRDLFKIYTSAKIKHPATMSADMVRGIWAIKSPKRCQEVLNKKYPPGKIEVFTDHAFKEAPSIRKDPK